MSYLILNIGSLMPLKQHIRTVVTVEIQTVNVVSDVPYVVDEL